MWWKLLIISVCVAIITIGVVTWHEASPWQRNYQGQVIDPLQLTGEPIPSKWWALAYHPDEGTAAAGIYDDEQECQQELTDFWLHVELASQESEFAQTQFYCERRLGGGQMESILANYIAQVQTLLDQAEQTTTSVSPAPIANSPTPTLATPSPVPTGSYKWMIVATNKVTGNKISFSDLPWFDFAYQCQERLEQLLDRDLAAWGQQTLKQEHEFACVERFWPAD